jgi:calcineurin-like phosphoesterase family protein
MVSIRSKKKWFWSDTHLFHAKILEFTDQNEQLVRGKKFKTIKEHNECLLENWNSCCKEGDKGYWLGDVGVGVPEQSEFTDFLKKFKGNLAMFLGNHDHIHQPAYGRFRYIDLWSGGKFKPHNFVCSHIPLRKDTMRDGEYNVHGHIHHNLVMKEHVYSGEFEGWDVEYLPDPHYINVCVEHTDYKPVELDEIIARIKKHSGETEV